MPAAREEGEPAAQPISTLKDLLAWQPGSLPFEKECAASELLPNQVSTTSSMRQACTNFESSSDVITSHNDSTEESHKIITPNYGYVNWSPIGLCVRIVTSIKAMFQLA